MRLPLQSRDSLYTLNGQAHEAFHRIRIMIWSGRPGKKKTAANLDLVPFASFSVFRRSFRLHLGFPEIFSTDMPSQQNLMIRIANVETSIKL